MDAIEALAHSLKTGERVRIVGDVCHWYEVESNPPSGEPLGLIPRGAYLGIRHMITANGSPVQWEIVPQTEKEKAE